MLLMIMLACLAVAAGGPRWADDSGVHEWLPVVVSTTCFHQPDAAVVSAILTSLGVSAAWQTRRLRRWRGHTATKLANLLRELADHLMYYVDSDLEIDREELVNQLGTNIDRALDAEAEEEAEPKRAKGA